MNPEAVVSHDVIGPNKRQINIFLTTFAARLKTELDCPHPIDYYQPVPQRHLRAMISRCADWSSTEVGTCSNGFVIRGGIR